MFMDNSAVVWLALSKTVRTLNLLLMAATLTMGTSLYDALLTRSVESLEISRYASRMPVRKHEKCVQIS